jgi:hypothetical protein
LFISQINVFYIFLRAFQFKLQKKKTWPFNYFMPFRLMLKTKQKY